jgi:hypothetical protein
VRLRSLLFTLNLSKGALSCRKPLLSPTNTATCQLQESPTNPRRRFDERALEELATSFATQDVLQPLLSAVLIWIGMRLSRERAGSVPQPREGADRPAAWRRVLNRRSIPATVKRAIE